MSIDKKFSSFIANYRGRGSLMDSFAVFCASKLIMYLGLFVFVSAAVAGEYASDSGGLWFFKAFLATALAWTVTLILEYTFNRSRPFQALHKKTLGKHWVPTPSFPSGHATIAFALATVGCLAMPSLACYLYIPAALIAFGRVYVGVHYLSDVVVGAIVGSVVSWGILMLLA